MADTDIHSCGYYCDRHACIVAQRDDLRDKLFSDQAVKTYSGGKPNYTQPIEQEPVAYIDVETRNLSWAKLTRWETPTVVKMDKIPLYTTPPKKEWVGLTTDEVFELASTRLPHGLFAGLIEAKLKEKNT
jgi:hypothetical protein